MTFAEPLLLLTLLAIPAAVAAWALVERRGRARYAVRFTNLDVLAGVIGGGVAWRRYVAPGLFLLALGALCIGLARPRVSRLVPTDRATVILVIDASGSMQARDVKPTRLGAAEQAAREFLARVPSRLRVGLVVFAGEPQVAAPPTTDRALVSQSLGQLAMFPGFGGTAIGDALAEAVLLGQQAIGTGRSNRGLASATATPGDLVSILFLSDGAQTRGLLQPLEGAQRAREAGFRVYTVALGTPDGTLTRSDGAYDQAIPVPPDPTTLRAIAQVTGGEFFNATSEQKLKDAYSKLGSSLGRTSRPSEITFAFLVAATAQLLAAGVAAAFWSPRLP